MPRAQTRVPTRRSTSYSPVQESNYNIDRFSHARRDVSRPYPSLGNVMDRTNTADPNEGFTNLGFRDFIQASRRVSRRKLARIETNPYATELLNRGVKFVTETNETFNSVLEASVIHTGNIGSMLMDEIAHVNKRVDGRRDEIENLEKDVAVLQDWMMKTDDAAKKQAADLDMLKGEMITLKDLIQSLVDHTGRLEDNKVRLTRRVSELTGEVRDLQRRCNEPEVRVEEEEPEVPHRAGSPIIPNRAESPPARLLVRHENRLVPIDDEVIEIGSDEFYQNVGVVRRDTPRPEFVSTPWGSRRQWPALEYDPNSDTELPDYDDLSDVDPNEIREQNWLNEELVMMEQWLQYRSVVLDEFLRLDSLGDALGGSQPCANCSNAPAQFRCKDCFGDTMRCSACTLSSHLNLPLHRLQLWNGGFFESATLEGLGLIINLGHDTNTCPVNPETRLITVIDLSGYHFLLRVRWYPASILRPKTVFTFDLLDTYHKISLQGKLNLYNFYTMIMQKTDNCGRLDVKYRYHEISRCARQWRHLKDIKRGAAGHTSTTVDDLGDGALAIECPACPHPGQNLPPGWENATEDKVWLYSLFIAIDANFRLKLKSRGIKDPELGSGLAYFVNASKFDEHLGDRVNEDTIETCGTEFHAVNQANSKYSRDFTVSGVGAVVCRHGFVRKNGVVDFQKGERFVNMDYIFLSTVKDEEVKIIKISYDIACRWSIKLRQRIQGYSEELQFPEDKFMLEFFIPKFHLPAHGSSCHTKYSFNYRPGVGRTHGENIESGWAHTNPAAVSTREMGAGARHSALDGHWGGWNWRKIIGFGTVFHIIRNHPTRPLLLKNIRKAVGMARKPPAVIHEWKTMKLRWEEDPSQPDPYQLVEKASKFNSMKWKLSEAKVSDPKSRNMAPHKLSPLSFVRMGLEIEDQQQQVVAHLMSKVQRTDPQKLEIQERRNILARQINLWRTAQIIYMPQVSDYLAGERDLPVLDDHEFDDSKPELWQLFLPSQLSEDDRSSCHEGIAEMERALCLAQVQDNLVQCSQRGSENQTKSRAAESGISVRIGQTVHRYRLAYAALLSLDPTGDWRDEYLELADKDNRGPGKEVEEQGVGDGCYSMSWIWRGSVGALQHEANLPEQEVNETVRHEWMTCRARADRWTEEADLLQEEMRRVVAFLEWKSTWWSNKVGSRLGSTAPDIQHGIDGYARKQANTYHKLAISLTKKWIPHLLALELDVSWAKTYPGLPRWPPQQRGGLSASGDLNNTTPCGQQDLVINPTGSDNSSGDESDGGDLLVIGDHDEGESSDGAGIGFSYDD
ncbi:hypothetical protein BJ322DRAFT_1109984 [Thelephora terrestris]|uniref:CxC2-like cysteine cluster KDZ transposase-associated domain-containing protein n=1 Tax=Thelephora terrestris TaxID=56493 RepID=A0A9P6L614_9AGAM|nr:hypothetical protein BJ322DRAFT_1109984 [Thelephora terrestris]